MFFTNQCLQLIEIYLSGLNQQNRQVWARSGAQPALLAWQVIFQPDVHQVWQDGTVCRMSFYNWSKSVNTTIGPVFI